MVLLIAIITTFSPLLMVHAPRDRPWARRVGIVLVVLSLMFVWFVAYLIEIHGENSGSWLYPGPLLLVGLGVSIPIVARLEGTNVEEGKRVLRDSDIGIISADGMNDAAEKVVSAANATY